MWTEKEIVHNTIIPPAVVRWLHQYLLGEVIHQYQCDGDQSHDPALFLPCSCGRVRWLGGRRTCAPSGTWRPAPWTAVKPRADWSTCWFPPETAWWPERDEDVVVNTDAAIQRWEPGCETRTSSREVPSGASENTRGLLPKDQLRRFYGFSIHN